MPKHVGRRIFDRFWALFSKPAPRRVMVVRDFVPPTPKPPTKVKPHICSGCGSFGFDESPMTGRCSFCDGTEGGNPPTVEDIDAWNATHKE